MELLTKLGIDWRLLIAQIMNFLVLFFVLYKFLYRPILGILEKRRLQIKNNDAKTSALETKMQDAEQMYEEKLHVAKQQSQDLLRQAEEQSQKIREEIVENAKKEATSVLEEVKQLAEVERQRTLDEVHRESRALIKSSVEKILRSIADDKTTELLVHKAEQEINKIN